MALGRTHAVALSGLSGAIVDIEADISSNLPGIVIIGLPDAALSQARDRVRAAAVNSGCGFPTHKVTVNLSPASLPKHGSAFDLAIAVAVLAAAGSVSAESIDYSTVMVPTANADEAALVPGIRVVPVASLREAAIWHGGEYEPEPVEAIAPVAVAKEHAATGDLADVVGNGEAVDALIAAAAGGHHMFLLGPPGAGKTMLAARLPGLLPDLDSRASLEVSSVHSLAGLPVGDCLITRPPFEAPHHTASAAALVGGGSGMIRPGAIARASDGVLFLDEAPEFGPSALDALRQPLESGVITIHRAGGVATYPARVQLVLAANPCPCGQYGARDSECTCPPTARRRYLARLSGPLLDRIDIQLRVPRITAAHLRTAQDIPRHSTADARARVVVARNTAAERLADTPWRVNAHVSGSWLRGRGMRLPASVTVELDRALERGGITMRGYDRVLRLAWTLADLDGASRPAADHLGRALYLRRAIST